MSYEVVKKYKHGVTFAASCLIMATKKFILTDLQINTLVVQSCGRPKFS